MKLGINTAITSQQRTPQKQPSFSAFKYVQPLEELRPIVRRAQEESLKICLPEDIIETMREGSISGPIERLSEIIKNHLFTTHEKWEICTQVKEGAENVIAKAQDIVGKAIPLPLEKIKKSIELLEALRRKVRENERIIEEAKLNIAAAESNINSYKSAEGHESRILGAYGL